MNCPKRFNFALQQNELEKLEFQVVKGEYEEGLDFEIFEGEDGGLCWHCL